MDSLLVIGSLPRVLEVSRVMDDTEVPRILWVKCATSAECKTIRIAVSTVKDSWVTALGLPPLVYKLVCVGRTTWVKSKDLTWMSWVGAHITSDGRVIGALSRDGVVPGRAAKNIFMGHRTHRWYPRACEM